MNFREIIFSGHAIRQMFHRELSKNDVSNVLKNGEIIIEYPDDKPYPSYLMLGFINNKPIHVVFALDKDNQVGIVVTAYVPDIKLWTTDFRTRRTL